MKIPEGKTEKEILDIIINLCNTFKNKYKTDIYDEDDMFQECYLICIDGLERYDNKRPIENFLCVHLRNRLLNFRRNINNKDLELKELPEEYDAPYVEKVRLIVEVDELLDEVLDPESRADWLRIKDGVKVPMVRKKKVKAKIKEVYEQSRH